MTTVKTLSCRSNSSCPLDSIKTSCCPRWDSGPMNSCIQFFEKKKLIRVPFGQDIIYALLTERSDLRRWRIKKNNVMRVVLFLGIHKLFKIRAIKN